MSHTAEPNDNDAAVEVTMFAFVSGLVLAAFVLNAAVLIILLRVILRPGTSETVQLHALKLARSAQRLFATVIVVGLLGLGAKAGIVPSIPLSTFLDSFITGQSED